MLLTIDPGLNNCGVVVSDPVNGFTVIDSLCVKNTRKFSDEEKILELKYGSRAVKVLSIVKSIEEMVDRYSPTKIIVESPFYHHLTPMSYSILLEVIVAIRYMVVMPRNIDFGSIEPMLIKKLFTSHGASSKDVMREFLIRKIDEGSIKIHRPVAELSEHEVDAIAVGYVFKISVLDQQKESAC